MWFLVNYVVEKGYKMLDISFEQVLLGLGIFSTVLFILKLIVFVLIGGDFEVQADFDSMGETDIAFNFLSVQTVLAFFMGFSWMGLVAVKQFNTPMWVSMFIAFFVGLVFLFGTAYLMFLVKKLDKKIVVKLEECVGQQGKAYTDIQPNSEGKIEIVINKKLVVVEAISLCDEKIDAFSQIKVEKVENNKLYVNKI